MQNKILRTGLCCLAVLSGILGGMLGCANQGSEKIKERAEVEGQAQAQAQAKAERDSQEARAKEMESDLQQRESYYQALSGTYEGKFQLAGEEFRARLRLAPSLSIYRGTRVRTADEITSDLNTLNLVVQSTHWPLSAPSAAVGCLFLAVRPDLKLGTIHTFLDTCPYTLDFSLSSDELVSAKSMGQKILNGELKQVEALNLQMKPTARPDVFSMALKRVPEALP